jgi:uncharacterized protein YlaN (UPF0358 family)
MQVENAMTLAAHSIIHEVKMQVENAMTLAAHSILHAVKMQVENFNDPGCTYA